MVVGTLPRTHVVEVGAIRRTSVIVRSRVIGRSCGMDVPREFGISGSPDGEAPTYEALCLEAAGGIEPPYGALQAPA
jgi:hypothetical protein